MTLALENPAQSQQLRTNMPDRGGWGRLPEISLSIAAGLLLVSLAYAGGRSGAAWAETTFWAGQLAMFLPVVVRLLPSGLKSERETFGMVVILAAGYFATKYCYSPMGFKFIDELQHWRSTEEILITSHLFEYNHSLPISPYYPGLENVTIAVISLTGLSIFTAGLIVIGAARVLLTVGLYLLFRQVSGSVRVAGLASVLFTTTSHYKFVLAMFIYMGLALPFLVLVVYAAVRITDVPQRAARHVWWMLAAVCIATTVATHHITSYILVLTLALSSVIFLLRRQVMNGLKVVGLTVVSLAFISLWLVVIAPETVEYLRPALSSLTQGISLYLSGDTPKEGGLLRGYVPLFDRVMSYLGIFIIAVCLPVGWHRIWCTQRTNPWALTMLVGSAGYYAVPIIRVVSASGGEHSLYVLTYLFIPVAYVLAVGAVGLLGGLARPSLAIACSTVLAGLIMVSGVTSGWPPYWERLPGRYLVGGYESSIEPESLAAADWSVASLRAGNRIAADDTDYTLMGTYGQQNAVQGVATLYYSKDFTDENRELVVDKGIQYVAVDLRLSRQLPASGKYFPDDPLAFQHIQPLPIEALTKFDRVDGAHRVFDSGNMVVYDVRGVRHAP